MNKPCLTRSLAASAALLAILATSHAMTATPPTPNGGGSPCWAPDGKKVAFVSATPNSPINLWVLDLARNHYQQISRLGGRYVAWSPDSRTIYYQTLSNGHSAIFAAPLGGGAHQPVLTFLGDDVPFVTAAPDGKRVAYLRRVGKRRDLWVSDWAGANPLQLTKDVPVRSVSWSHDSQFLAYDVGGVIGEVTNVIAASGGEPRPAFKAMGNWPSWAPDGKTVAVFGMHAMSVFKADGSGDTRLHISQDDRGPASWSPDGKLIAYTCIDRAARGIATVTSDTGKTVILSTGWTQAGSVHWSPDGHALLFEGIRPGSAITNVFIMDVKTRLYRPLTTATSSQYSPWQSGDGKATFFLADGVHASRITLRRTTAGGTVSLLNVDPRSPLQFSWPRKASCGLLTNGQSIWLLFSAAPPRPLLSTEHPTSADLSPAGDRLVYVKWQQHQPSLVVRELPGGAEQELLPSPAAGQGYGKLAWSPTGDTIAFVSGKAVRTVALADKTVKTVWEPSPQAAEGVLLPPRWSPDGKRLAYGRFALDGGQRLEISVVGVSGEAPQLVATAPVVAEHGLYGDPLSLPYDWSPAGRLVYCLEKDGRPTLYVADPLGQPMEPVELRQGAAYPQWLNEREILCTSLDGTREATVRVSAPAGGKPGAGGPR